MSCLLPPRGVAAAAEEVDPFAREWGRLAQLSEREAVARQRLYHGEGMAGVPEAEPVRLRLSREAFAGRTVGTFCLVDVRTPAEFRAIHAEGAALVPLNCLDAKSLGSQSRGPVYLICASGARARLAAETLDAAGVPQPTMIQGGTSAWEAGGLPVVRGKNLISLERQVRIAAGSPVLTDTLLGWFVNR